MFMYLCMACVQLFFPLNIRKQFDSKHSLSCPPKPYAICDMVNAIYSCMSLSSEENVLVDMKGYVWNRLFRERPTHPT